MTAPRALVVDDEPLARQTLRDLLAQPPPGVDAPFDAVHVVAEAADGDRALELVRELRPDLVFLDVQMPGRSGLEVLAAFDDAPTPPAAVVLTTAYDQYALAAYELGAVDYLLKPFGPDRLARALRRAAPLLAVAPSGRPRLAERVDAARAALTAGPLDRLFVRRPGGVALVATADLVRVEAQGDYAMLHARDGGRHLVYLTLAELEARLCPRTFLRVHRSHIVNLDRVLGITAHDESRLAIDLDDGSEVVASRARSRLLRTLAR